VEAGVATVSFENKKTSKRCKKDPRSI